MYFISNEMNSNKILDKIDTLHNDTNVMKKRIVNEIKWNAFFFNLNSNTIFLKKLILKWNEILFLDILNKGLILWKNEDVNLE